MNENNLQEAKSAAAKALLGPNFPNNVVGVGIGNKVTKGQDTGTPCVRVYVLSKLSTDKLTLSAVVPADFLGVPTDVIPVGRYGRTGRLENPPLDTSSIGPGCMIRVAADSCNVNSGAFGSLGGIVSDSAGNDYILSCNHILAANGRVPQNRNIFSNEKLIGCFGGSQFCVELNRDQPNLVDCALGRLIDKTVSLDIPQEFAFLKECKVIASDPIAPARGMAVAKAGAISGTTTGTIVDVDADGYIEYSFGTYRFANQVVIDSGDDKIEFAVSGDSGSVVRDRQTGAATAMIFAAAGRFAVACPLSVVLKALGDAISSNLTLRVGEPDAKACRNRDVGKETGAVPRST